MITGTNLWRGVLLHLGQQLDAVHVRHVHVADDQVHLAGLVQRGQRLLAVAGFQHRRSRHVPARSSPRCAARLESSTIRMVLAMGVSAQKKVVSVLAAGAGAWRPGVAMARWSCVV
jgi:hypothetical protein